MKGFIPMEVLSLCADCCCDSLGTLVEIYNDSFRDEFCGQPLIYSRDFIENVRFRRWNRFLNDVRQLSFFGILHFEKVGKDVIEITILEVPTEIEKE